MPHVPMQWGEWRPDLATTDSQLSNDVENVFPGTNSYIPIPDLVRFSSTAIPSGEAANGFFAARTTAVGDWRIYVGTPTKLYEWKASGWVDVTRATGGAYAVIPGNLWSFTQFGKWLIAVHPDDNPQAIDVDAPTGKFADLAGSPPKAANAHTVGDFVVLSGLTTNPRMIKWCAINDTTSWIVGLNLCDEQEFPDGGPVQGVAGDKIGYVVQDRAVRTMQFLPGDTTYIFSFSKVVYDRGSISKYGFTTIGDVLYLLCEDGFYSLAGAQLLPIGFEKINEWFMTNSDVGRRDIVQAITAVRPYIIWPYHRSAATPAKNYDACIIFNWMSARWSRAVLDAQMWATIATVGYDLETDSPEPGDTSLDSTARELDSTFYIGGRPRVAAIDPAGFLCSLDGPNLQATLESPEVHPIPGQRAMVGDVYPLADAAEGVIYNGTRERLQDQVTWTGAAPIEITGSAAVYNSSRLHRFRHVIPRAAVWTHAQGVMADSQPDGTVA